MTPRLLAGGRLVYGTMLLIKPEAVLGELTGPTVDRRARTFARVLGVRQIIQSVLVPGDASRDRVLIGAAVDTIHGATMAVLAVLDPTRRRLAGANVVVASAFTLAGLRRASRG